MVSTRFQLGAQAGGVDALTAEEFDGHAVLDREQADQEVAGADPPSAVEVGGGTDGQKLPSCPNYGVDVLTDDLACSGHCWTLAPS